MNNRGQNGNSNGTPQNHHPNQGYPQQNNHYQGKGYNGQNPQNFNRNVNNQNPYQNQNSQVNNVNNPQYRGQGNNGQNPQYNNMNNPQYRGQGHNGQNQPHNNMNNPQYRGQGNNGQNPQFGSPNNSQFSNQNGYNNPNQFNPQSGNNQNFNPMNRRPKMNSKMVGYITAAVAAILVVLMIFMFSSGSGNPGGASSGNPGGASSGKLGGASSGKLGGATPEEVMRNYIAAAKDGDFDKMVNNLYVESGEYEDEARSTVSEFFKTKDDGYKNELAKVFSDVEIGKVKLINENRAKVELKAGGKSTETTYVKKANGRWFHEGYIDQNIFSSK